MFNCSLFSLVAFEVDDMFCLDCRCVGVCGSVGVWGGSVNSCIL